MVVWRDQAEHAAASLPTGSRVLVVGGPVQRCWQPDDATSRAVVGAVADELAEPQVGDATTPRATRSPSQ